MTPPDRKILIAAEIAPRRIGSYERSHFGVASELESRGWEVLSAFSGEISEPVRDHFRPREASLITGLGDASGWRSRRAWIELFHREQPDALWFHFFPTMGALAWQARRALTHAAIFETDHISRGPIRRAFLKELGHRARLAASAHWLDAHIAVSRFIADRMVTSDLIPRHKVRVIYNGIDLDAFLPAERPGGGDYLCTVCYMRPEKGVGVLLEALAILKRSGIEPRCLLVGDGPNLTEYRRIAEANGLSKVEFTGLRNDVPQLLRSSMLSVVPSIWSEAFSNAAAEAQALGVPVIASAIGGLQEVIEDGVSGLHVTPGDPAGLAGAIARLVGDPELRAAMGKAGRERVGRLFNLKDRISEMADFIEELASNPRHELRPEHSGPGDLAGIEGTLGLP